MQYAPLALIAEITHRCPLHCVYCSNPIEMQNRGNEMSTADWQRVIEQAAQIGVLQLHLTGGEPTARDDIVELIQHGRANRLYTNLITSGVNLSEEKLKSFCAAGLDHIQLSLQDAQETFANEYAGTKAHALKLKAGKMIKNHPLAFTLNIVIHRQNISRLEEMIALGESIGADRFEIAHVQYYGWAFKNRNLLMPTQDQVDASMKIIYAAVARLKGKVRIDFALPDYYARFPKTCMGGWGQSSMLVDPAGRVLPCHSAMVLPNLQFENVREKSLGEIWELSNAFQKYRGDSWMKEPCSSCDRKKQDFGGCRCQAFLLTGDDRLADPACSLSPGRKVMNEVVQDSIRETIQAWAYRKMGK